MYTVGDRGTCRNKEGQTVKLAKFIIAFSYKSSDYFTQSIMLSILTFLFFFFCNGG